MAECRGCGGPMPPKQRPSRNDRVWCSRACYRGRPKTLPGLKQDRYKRRNRDKWLAVAAVNRHVKAGTMRRLPCQECGTEPAYGHHHRGYDEEHKLDVIWLCQKHHVEAHRVA